jgi:hypothetical protein
MNARSGPYGGSLRWPKPLAAANWTGNQPKYIVAVENDVPDAKLEITDEDLKKAVKHNRKTKPKNN